MYRSGRTEVVRPMYRNGHVPNWSYPIFHTRVLNEETILSIQPTANQLKRMDYIRAIDDLTQPAGYRTTLARCQDMPSILVIQQKEYSCIMVMVWFRTKLFRILHRMNEK